MFSNTLNLRKTKREISANPKKKKIFTGISIIANRQIKTKKREVNTIPPKRKCSNRLMFFLKKNILHPKPSNHHITYTDH